MTQVLEVAHDTGYAYAAPVAHALHVAHLRPLEDAHQALLDHTLRIEPAPSERQDSRDAFGNRQTHFGLLQPHDALSVRATTRVAVRSRFDALQPDQSPPWEAVREGLRYVARAPMPPAVEFAQPSPFVPRLDALHDYARPSFAPGRPAAEAALDLMRRIHADFTYQPRSTDVDTPVRQAFERREGVCQDFAHVLIGCLRRLGLPARYVSGYLLTTASGPALVGADASHAWVQVHLPGTPGLPPDSWLDLDPTNALVPGTTHVRVAVGRDYGDVAPLRGVIRGGGRHTLTVGVTTRALDPARELLQSVQEREARP